MLAGGAEARQRPLVIAEADRFVQHDVWHSPGEGLGKLVCRAYFQLALFRSHEPSERASQQDQSHGHDRACEVYCVQLHRELATLRPRHVHDNLFKLFAR